MRENRHCKKVMRGQVIPRSSKISDGNVGGGKGKIAQRGMVSYRLLPMRREDAL